MDAQEWARIKFFKPAEFDSKDVPGSGYAGMKFELVSKLDELRMAWGKAIRVSSGLRSRARNEAVGGKPNSAHLRGLAADLETSSIQEAIKMAVVAARLGFPRIGVDLKGGYVHVDVDEDLPSPVTWFYNESSPTA